MGTCKPLLPFGDKTVIENCIDYLTAGGVQTIVVVLGHQAAELKTSLKDRQVQFALNPNPKSEMSESIACGVRKLRGDSRVTFITPADYPAVPAEVVVELLDHWRTGAAKLLLPEYQGRGGHPVLVDLSFRDELLHLEPERGLRSLFDAHRGQVRRVPVKSPFVARDIDTWDDYRSLYREVIGREPPELSWS